MTDWTIQTDQRSPETFGEMVSNYRRGFSCESTLDQMDESDMRDLITWLVAAWPQNADIPGSGFGYTRH